MSLFIKIWNTARVIVDLLITIWDLTQKNKK